MFQVPKSRGQYCGDIELVAYLANAAGPVPLVMDLLITHDRFGSTSDPNLNPHLHYYPNDIDRSLNETDTDKIRKYRSDCNHNPPNNTSFMTVNTSTSGRLHSELYDFCSYRVIGKLTAFLQVQEFSLRKPTVSSSTSVTRLSLHTSKTELG